MAKSKHQHLRSSQSHLDMQPRKSCSAAASSACWLTCFPLAPGFAAFRSPCDRPPAMMQRQQSWPSILWPSCYGQTTAAKKSQSSSFGPRLRLRKLSERKRKPSTTIWLEGRYSYRYAVAVCESWLGARVCQPHWSVGLVTQAMSIRSLVGSRRINKHSVKSRKRHYGIYSAERLLNETPGSASVFVMVKFSTPSCEKILANVWHDEWHG